MTEKKMIYVTKAFVKYLLIFTLCIFISGCNLDSEKSQINEKTVDEIISKAKPVIEEITGRKFKADIEYKIVSRNDFQNKLKEDMLNNIREWEKESNEDMRKRFIEMSAQFRSQFHIARHLHRENLIYIIHNNINPIKELYEIGDEDLDDFLFIIIAHEILHTLDNQYYDLAKLLYEAKNTEELRAREAVMGGSAAFVMRKLAARLNIKESLYEKSLMLDNCMKDNENTVVNERYNLYFVEGEEFMQAIIDKKGSEGYGSAFLSPPSTTREIYNPAEYINQKAVAKIDCAMLLKKVLPSIPKNEEMRSDTAVIGTTAIIGRLINEGINEEDAKLIADNCMNAVSHISFLRSINPVSFIITMINFDEIEIAKKYDEINKLIDQSKDDQLKAKLNTTFNLLYSKSISIESYDNVIIKNAEIIEDGKKTKKILVTGITNNLHVTIDSINMEELTEDNLIEILKLIHSEYMVMKHGEKAASL